MLVAGQAAPQFYITPKQALDQYNQYKRSGKLDTDNPLTAQMYHDIFERYEKLLATNPCDYKYSIMQDVLESPAPSFYIKPSAATAFYYRAMAYKRRLNRSKRK